MTATIQTGGGGRLLHVVRLAAGTRVLALCGAVPAGSLRPGDRLVGRAGAIRVAAVTVEVQRDTEMLRIGVGTIAHGLPGAAVVLPLDQPLRLSGERADLVYGHAPVTVAAARLADGRLNRIIRLPEVRVVTLAFAAPAALYAGDMQPVTQPQVAEARI